MAEKVKCLNPDNNPKCAGEFERDWVYIHPTDPDFNKLCPSCAEFRRLSRKMGGGRPW